MSGLRTLRHVLASLYPREPDQRRLAVESGLREASIAFDRVADNAWFEILRTAEQQGKLRALFDLAVSENPDNVMLARALDDVAPVPMTGPDMKSIGWQGPKNARGVLEKITSIESALVPVSFLELGIARARAVAKVELASGASGSGFVIAGDLLVTNHHVFPDAASAVGSRAIMQFQQDVAGLASASVPVAIEPDKYFATSLEDDLSVVRLADGAAATWGALDITPRDVAMDDRVNIVQHPGGGYKQLSFFANVVVFVGGGRVQYLTDTLPGSSGAPVFDRQWNLVAVHHSGGWLTEPGSTDPKRVFYRNEGILLDRLPPLLPK